MKLIKLSLMTMLAFNTAIVAEDSIVDAFSNGKFKGELKASYYDRDYSSSRAGIFTGNLILNYVTGSFYGFSAGATTQTSSSPFVSDKAKDMYSSKPDMYGDGSVMSEAYLAYTINKTNIKYGRQFINMPLINSGKVNIVQQSFEGATIVDKSIPDTTLSGGYITMTQNRTDGDGNIAEFEDSGNGFAVSAMNKSIKGLGLTIAYGEQEDSHHIFAAEASYKNKIGDVRYNLAAQYSKTDYESSTNKDDASFAGAKIGAGIGDFNAYIAYDKIQDGNSKYGLFGGPRSFIYTATVIYKGMYDESEQYAVDLNYAIKSLNTKIGVRHVDIDYERVNASARSDLRHSKRSIYNTFYATYKYNKIFTARLEYGTTDNDNETIAYPDVNELRIKTIFSF